MAKHLPRPGETAHMFVYHSIGYEDKIVMKADIETAGSEVIKTTIQGERRVRLPRETKTVKVGSVLFQPKFAHNLASVMKDTHYCSRRWIAS